MPVSLAAKPEPVTVTELPTAPLCRLRDMPEVTVKVRSGTIAGVVTEPDVSMLCEPEAEAGTRKAVLQALGAGSDIRSNGSAVIGHGNAGFAGSKT